MNILPLGDCNNAHANEESHVKSITIKELAKDLRTIKNIPETDSIAKGTKIQQLLLIKSHVNQCISIVKNDLIRHNHSKLPKLEKLLQDTEGVLQKTTSKYRLENTGTKPKEVRAAAGNDNMAYEAGPSSTP